MSDFHDIFICLEPLLQELSSDELFKAALIPAPILTRNNPSETPYSQ